MKCPVCNKEMISKIPNIMSCEKQIVWISELEDSIISYHSVAATDDNSNPLLIVIELLPYLITIDYKHNSTRIEKHMWEENEYGDLKKEDIVRFNAVLDWPWDDYQKVMEKIKMYLVFS